MKTLRPYQQRTNTRVRGLELCGRKRICIHGPTGSGKGLVIADLLFDPKPQLLLTHRRILLDQLSRVLTSQGVPHGMRASGYPATPDAPIQLGMIQTEFARVFKKGGQWSMHKCERLVVDELHAFRARIAQRVFGAYQAAGASFVGVTATPTEVGHLVSDLVVMATVPELINAGYLVPPVVYTPDGPDCDHLEFVTRQANGEFAPAEIKKLWEPSIIFGRVVEHYQRLNPEQKPAVLFSPSVPSSLWFAQKLRAAGILAAHIDGKQIWVDGEFYESDSDTREWLFDRVRTGDIKVLCNRFVLREGLDLPEIEHVILACIFGTRHAFVQACGRGLRPSPGKERSIFQDHGGNAWRFPALDDGAPWDYETSARELETIRRDKRRLAQEHPDDPPPDAEPEPIVCPKCDCLRVAGPECPECGHRSTLQSRNVIELSGELRRVTGPIYKPRDITRTPRDTKTWENLFWGARKYKHTQTLRQIYSYYAYTHDWHWLPRDLPLMPKPGKEHLWGYRAKDIPLGDLR